MTRAKWKGPYVDTTLLKKNKRKIKTTSRNSEIIPAFVGKILSVHNGKKYIDIQITDQMIGHKLGEFVFSRKKFTFKKK